MNADQCLFSGKPCSEEAIKPDKENHCVCFHCEAWLAQQIPGFKTLEMKLELEALKNHLDACHKALGVSHLSSRPLSHYILDWRKALETIVQTTVSEDISDIATHALRLQPGQTTVDERGDIV